MTARRAAHEPVAVLDHACRYEREPLARPDGFDEGMVEKVLHLVHLLNGLNSHPALRGKWVLKGGTALNLFVLRHPRLSVDIDLNYIGALAREDMLADRPKSSRRPTQCFPVKGSPFGGCRANTPAESGG